MSVDQIIGERVNTWLRRKRLMQMELADFLGIQRSVVSRKVSGHVSWSATDLVKTAAFLDVPLSELLPEETVEMAKAPDLVGSGAVSSHLRESNSRPSHYE
ncbi:helix-turn-helix domain-containing protein [Trueperella bialowiezensis]|uniref:helix-turn-helix domain-containing protein n=1 Tax=Trueperella bialowiezensis TaxID=312285 RepID=UPI00389B2781